MTSINSTGLHNHDTDTNCNSISLPYLHKTRGQYFHDILFNKSLISYQEESFSPSRISKKLIRHFLLLRRKRNRRLQSNTEISAFVISRDHKVEILSLLADGISEHEPPQQVCN